MRESIFALVSLSKTDFKDVYDDTLSILADVTKTSQGSHQLFVEAIQYGIQALKIRRAFVLPASVRPELAHHAAEQWTFAVFFSGVVCKLQLKKPDHEPLALLSHAALLWLDTDVKEAINKYLSSSTGELHLIFDRLDNPDKRLPSLPTTELQTSSASASGAVGRGTVGIEFQYFSCLFGYISAFTKKQKETNLYNCDGSLVITHSTIQRFLAACAPGVKITRFSEVMVASGVEVSHEHIVSGDIAADGWLIPKMLELVSSQNQQYAKATIATNKNEVDWDSLYSDIINAFGKGAVPKKPFRQMLILKHRCALPYSTCALHIKEATGHEIEFVD